MKTRSPDIDHEYTPNEDLMALVPDVSGNDINGVGEVGFRRPSPVYWQEPDSIAHGKMQKWFGSQDLIVDVLDALQRRQVIFDTPMSDVADTPVENEPDVWAKLVEAAALDRGADLVGITAFDPDWTYDRFDPPADPWVIMIGGEQDFEKMLNVPGQIAGAEVLNIYGKVLETARTLSSWIREQGYHAEPFGSPTHAKFVQIPPALECGFGELGKHGSIINRRLGSNFRLSAVLTDMPLVAQKSDEFGVDDFCANCKICEKACVPGAIRSGKVHVRGVERWSVDFDKCIPYFNEHLGCSICTTVCPWSRPGVADNLVQKLARRRST
ncbi:MAG: 4Fe-4S dicluster domain-containing protein [Alphaproteobacteria bacterium]|jgi:epoxyqueuosine reductase|nr:4Fe-4S dicluster domain-containing protein [Alphaproteobacteria bacterium]MBT4019483.1 4Fe-4S dicluster domain-containing protein [Alphaproteobacteria bacterium]MBT4967305.1 4Fe-4S dicluster domain-containing protein [Alphaproteobacteria bacterium]MBT5159749.1 4Fe-4S dicluster domain-containing protein [Alphaproteobacteria bacterium]MBT5919271.1 4Fe-4S dicluster domain-containing protein [Alphaproteobacteria bacterium]